MPTKIEAPAPEGGAAPFDRDALIALIMEETTDDIIADGWDRLGKPNVLVQGCRYIRRNAPPSPEGYANPEASAKQFAGFIADRVLKALATREAHEFVQSFSTAREGGCKVCGRDEEAHREAPAEAGVEGAAWKWIAGRYPNDAPSDLAYDANELVDAFVAGASLRAQPPAREDAQPFMFAYEDVDKPGEWRAFRHQIKRADGSVCPGRALYTHSVHDAQPVHAFAERVFKAGHADGWSGNQTRRAAAHADAQEGWERYVRNGALSKSLAAVNFHPAPDQAEQRQE